MEGFGTAWDPFGHSWALLGRFVGVQDGAFLRLWSKIGFKRPSGSILEGFGMCLGRILKGFGGSLGKILLHLWKGFGKIWKRFLRRLWTVFDHFFEYFLSWDPRAASNIYKILTTRLPPENSSVQLLTRAMQQVWKGTTLQRLPAELSSLPSPLLKSIVIE